MIRTQKGVALCGTICVFLLVVTGLLMNGHVKYSQIRLPAAKSQYDVPPSSVLSQLDSAPHEQQFPEPSESLREISRFEGYDLPAAECQKEFADLFKGIELSAEYRKTIGNITSSDLDTSWIDDGSIRAMIYRQKVPALVLIPLVALTGT